MREVVKLSKTNPTVRKIIAASFPNYTGRKVKAVLTDRPVSLQTYWDGGSRDEAVAIEASGAVAEVPHFSPYDEGAMDFQHGVHLPHGILLVVHSHFMGKDAGITIYCSPDTAPMLGSDVRGLLGA